MTAALKWVGHEVRELLPAFFFFLVAFNIIVITDALTTEQYGIQPFRLMAAVIGALLVAKALLLANHLPFLNAFPGRPLIFNTLWKTMLYVMAALVVLYMEKLTELTIRHGSVVLANRHLFGDMQWPRFWAVQIWLAVMLLVFAALQDLTTYLGHGRLRQILIGR